MKRFHVHVGVKDIESSIQFYSTLFGQKPSKVKEDYAKWMLEDPRINFAISTHANTQGVDHLGIQVDEGSELTELTERLKKADLKVFGEGEATCCYAESSKAWVKDPAGVAWEAYHTMADAEVYSEKLKVKLGEKTACCAAAPSPSKSSCC
jgi:catechol-2,3-dioxygenase